MSSSSASSASPSLPFPVPQRLHNKVALITGGTRGIGYSIAERLGLEGASIVICSRNKKNVHEAETALKAKGIVNVLALVCHVGTEEARQNLVQQTVAKYGRIDILVSNVAANTIFGPMLSSTDEKNWDKIFDTNVKSHFFLIKSVVPHMPHSPSCPSSDPNILIISSYAGFHPSPTLGAYSVSKTALIGLTKVLSLELASSHIRINCLAPGIIQTKFSEALWKEESVGDEALKNIPMKRFGSSEEMAGVASFLVSKDAAYVTGETIVAGGGIMSRL